MIKVQRVSSEELNRLYVRPVEFTAWFGEENFIDRWNVTRDALEKWLSKKWRYADGGYPETSRDDFCIAEDFNISWAQCGAIFSRRALCWKFVASICEFLAARNETELWAVLFNISLFEHDHLQTGRGEFLILDDTLYIPNDDQFDYQPFVESLSASPGWRFW